MLKRRLTIALTFSLPFLLFACSGGTVSSGVGGSAGTTTTTTTGGTAGTGQGGSSGGTTGTSLPGAGGSQATGGASFSGGAQSGGATASGGAPAGGTPGTGGSTSNGGATAAGGTGAGGASNSGGVSATGGTTSAGGSRTGGATGTGGSTSAGGTTSKGGTTGTGGVTLAGGATAAGGTTSSGGTPGTGGSTSTGGCDVWVATDGNDANPGTQAQPVATIYHGYDLLCPPVTGAANGDVCAGALNTMCIKSGTYAMATRFQLKKTRMGTTTRVITIQADPAATARPILDFSSQPRLACSATPSDGNQRGIDLGADWFHIKGLEVKSANDNGIIVQGAHNIVEDCVVHDCADFGIAISSGSGYTGSGTYNTILNCDSYHNFDAQCSGENADGFGAKKGAGAGNVFRGCRSWSNSDDGYDFYGWTSQITLDNCWAFNMATESAYSGSGSDGNGFKLGSASSDGNHVLSNCISFGNKATGFTSNGGKASTCTNCKSCSNGKSDTGVSGVTSGGCPSASAAQAPRGTSGSLPAI